MSFFLPEQSPSGLAGGPVWSLICTLPFSMNSILFTSHIQFSKVLMDSNHLEKEKTYKHYSWNTSEKWKREWVCEVPGCQMQLCIASLKIPWYINRNTWELSTGIKTAHRAIYLLKKHNAYHRWLACLYLLNIFWCWCCLPAWGQFDKCIYGATSLPLTPGWFLMPTL